MATLFTFRLTGSDPDAILAAVDAHMARAPAMFADMPVALDLDALDPLPGTEALEKVLAGLRARKLAPTALRAGEAVDATLAERLGLGLLPGDGGDSGAQTNGGSGRAAASREPAPSTRYINRPVRSGQQVYARGGDLVILGAVGAGAEVLADGCVHVYGALNGRAGAGVQGDETARIFCQQFNAELVSIAGCYRVGDELPDGQRGRPAQVRLEDASLVIADLDAG